MTLQTHCLTLRNVSSSRNIIATEYCGKLEHQFIKIFYLSRFQSMDYHHTGTPLKGLDFVGSTQQNRELKLHNSILSTLEKTFLSMYGYVFQETGFSNISFGSTN